MLKLSPENARVFLMHVHQIINDRIEFVMKGLKSKEKDSLDYFVFTDNEQKYMDNIKDSVEFQEAIRKIVTRSLDT